MLSPGPLHNSGIFRGPLLSSHRSTRLPLSASPLQHGDSLLKPLQLTRIVLQQLIPDPVIKTFHITRPKFLSQTLFYISSQVINNFSLFLWWSSLIFCPNFAPRHAEAINKFNSADQPTFHLVPECTVRHFWSCRITDRSDLQVCRSHCFNCLNFGHSQLHTGNSRLRSLTKLLVAPETLCSGKAAT